MLVADFRGDVFRISLLGVRLAEMNIFCQVRDVSSVSYCIWCFIRNFVKCLSNYRNYPLTSPLGQLM